MAWLIVMIAFLGVGEEKAPDSSAAPSGTTQPEQKPEPPKLTEREKIDLLLKYVESLDVAFIRNGDEYPPKDAVAHMRRKLDYAGKRIKTARQFIKYIATESSVSGKPYLIRFKDGREVKSGEWLNKALDAIEKGIAPEKEPPKEKPGKEE